MKVTVLLVTAFLFIAPTAAAHAANMFAGPLFPAGSDQCECEIANVSTSAKTIEVIMLNDVGAVVGDSRAFSLPAGHVLVLEPAATGVPQYCKFVNASPTYFRASIACFGTPDFSDNVALPAR